MLKWLSVVKGSSCGIRVPPITVVPAKAVAITIIASNTAIVFLIIILYTGNIFGLYTAFIDSNIQTSEYLYVITSYGSLVCIIPQAISMGFMRHSISAILDAKIKVNPLKSR